MVYVFGEFELDTSLFELRHAGEPCPVEPQVFDFLTYLLQHRDRVVTKEELFEQLWPNRFVSEATLSHCLMAARKAVGDSGRTQRTIRTLHGRGFRFVTPVEEYTDNRRSRAEPGVLLDPFSRQLDQEESDELYELRRILGQEAGRLCAQSITPKDIHTLSRLVDEIESLTARGSMREFFPLNLEFHKFIVVRCGNKRLSETYLSIQREHWLFRQQQLVGLSGSREIGLANQREANAEHRQIVDALRGGNAERTGILFRLHDENCLRRSREVSKVQELVS